MNKKPDREELAKEVYCTAMRHEGHRDWSYCEEWRKQPWRDAVKYVLDKLNQPEPITLTQVQHLRLMAEIGKQTHGWWWQCLRSAMKSQWIQPGEYLPEPGESLLVRHKTGAVEEAQYDGQNFHEHSRPDLIISTYGISEWTYLYEPETKQERQTNE